MIDDGGPFLVRWLRIKNGMRIGAASFLNLSDAFAEMVKRDNDPFVDRTELIADKTRSAFVSCEALRDSYRLESVGEDQ